MFILRTGIAGGDVQNDEGRLPVYDPRLVKIEQMLSSKGPNR